MYELALDDFDGIAKAARDCVPMVQQTELLASSQATYRYSWVHVDRMLLITGRKWPASSDRVPDQDPEHRTGAHGQ